MNQFKNHYMSLKHLMSSIYYHKHKDEMDKETTHLLNKKFSIDGYRITKIKGVLCLKRSTMKKKDDLQESNH